MTRPRQLLATLVTSCLLLLVLVPAALASVPDGGQGTYGEADDKVVTNFGFVVIAFFPTLILLLSLLQWRLDKRREARKAARKRRGSSAQWSGGW
jgi:protein-S-isoprenylcysteine O-methyltransferase Ste14